MKRKEYEALMDLIEAKIRYEIEDDNCYSYKKLSKLRIEFEEQFVEEESVQLGTIAEINKIRDESGCGIIKARNAYIESGGDIQKAIEIARIPF